MKTRVAIGEQRRRVLATTKGHCSCCGTPSGEIHVHHIWAHADGGPTEDGNLAPLCRRCHREWHLFHDKPGMSEEAVRGAFAQFCSQPPRWLSGGVYSQITTDPELASLSVAEVTSHMNTAIAMIKLLDD